MPLLQESTPKRGKMQLYLLMLNAADMYTIVENLRILFCSTYRTAKESNQFIEIWRFIM